MATLGTSPDELRARMEAAGIPADQIAKVMSDPNQQQNLKDLPPPAYENRDRYGRAGAVSPAPGMQSTFIYAIQDEEPKTVFKAHIINNAPDDKRCYQKIVLNGLPKSQAAWAVEFLKNTGMSKQPHFRMFRQLDGDQKGNQVCECVFHHRLNNKVDIKHPWMDWGAGWDPDNDAWASDTGFQDEEWLFWDYHRKDDRYPGQAVLVCSTVEKLAKNSEGELTHLEVCRVILSSDIAPWIIELPVRIWRDAKDEQMDEMVSNAMINAYRRQLGWWNKPRTGGGGGTDTSAIAAINASTAATIASTC